MRPPPPVSYDRLVRHPRVFQHLTGIDSFDFDVLFADFLPPYRAAERARLSRPDRQRAIGAGRTFALSVRDQLLLSLIWLRRYPTDETLGFLFGLERTSIGDTRARIIPLLAALGLDTMRVPDPGKKQRPHLDELLRETPEVAVLVDTYEQPVQRHKRHAEADRYYSGKKKMHTMKTQISVDERDGRIVDVPPSVLGPTADLVVLKESGMLPRLPPGVGILGDLAYVGMGDLHPDVRGATPRRKPRGHPRPVADVAYNRAFARRRVPVEHGIGRMRRYECLSQRDRHHRRGITERNRAVAGRVNRTNWRVSD